MNARPILAVATMFIAATAAMPIAASAQAPKAAEMQATPHLMNAWVRLPAMAGRPAGGYFLAHGTSVADELTGVVSPKAGRVEMHSMANDNGVMKMRAETSFPLAAGGELKFAPGGNHLMLFDLAADVKAGDRIPLTFSFRSGAKVTIDAEVRAAGAPAAKMDHSNHH